MQDLDEKSGVAMRGIDAALRDAQQLQLRGDSAAAESLYLQVLARDPHNAVALHLLGVLATQAGNAARAVNLIAASIAIDPGQAAAYSNLGHAMMSLGRHAESVGFFDKALTLRPRYAKAWANRGIAQIHVGDLDAAVLSLSRALEEDPGNADALVNLGVALLRLERFDAALDSLDRAVRLAPGMAEAHNNRGIALRQLRKLEAARQCFDRAVQLQPDFAEALSNRASVSIPLGRLEEAMADLERSLSIKPDLHEAWLHLGAALKFRGRLEEAIQCLDRVLGIDAYRAAALQSRGSILMELNRGEEAAACFRRVLDIDPRHDYALGSLCEAQLRCGDWSGYAALRAKILAAVGDGAHAVRPFFCVALTDDPAVQLACSRLFAGRHYASDAGASTPAATPPRNSCDRIRLGYVSGDFRDHPVSYLTAGLFERHNRERFEVIAVSLSPAQESAIARRIMAGVDEFVDVSSLSDRRIASWMQERGIDVAIDLSGYTGSGRAGIFVERAAPVQINYLGYPATMGMACMDYILADEFLIPPAGRMHYAEQVVYLPGSFQVNDSAREIGTTPDRSACGLPEKGLVLCSFNNSYKLNPEFFAIWLRVMAAVDDAVLWLVADNDAVARNLRRSAACGGIAPERLIFARRLPYSMHLGRLRLADLCLDSLPFNAGTTASDALWAGVPLLTCAGRGLAARMAGSLLRAAGMPELVTQRIDEYESLAMRLAGDRAALAQLRAKLAANRLHAPLFDTGRFCTAVELAYSRMVEGHRRGDAPAHFAVGG